MNTNQTAAPFDSDIADRFGNASYGPYRVLVPGDFSRADRTRVIWVDYLFENGRGGTAPIEAILFDATA